MPLWKRVLITIVIVGLIIPLCFISLFALLLLIRDKSLRSKQLKNDGSWTPIDINSLLSNTHLLDRFTQAINIRTVGEKPLNDIPYQQFRQFIETNYPLVHERLSLEVFQNHTLLYRWTGTSSDNGCGPVMFINHYDVVPAGDLSLWTHPPFNATVSNNYIYGRGTLDTKSTAIATLEAVNHLIGLGHEPSRTMYFLFPHDEETTSQGSLAVARSFKERGIMLDWIIDEGTPINMIPSEDVGISKKKAPNGIAFIGLSDKGIMKVKLTVDGNGGGHASAPPVEKTAISILSSAIVSIESKKLETGFVEPVSTMIQYLTPEMNSVSKRILFNNLWLFGSRILQTWGNIKFLNPLVRCTVATTIVHGGVASNVLPQTAEAILDIRLRPIVDTCSGIMDYLEKTVDDKRVKMEMTLCIEKSSISKLDTKGFMSIQKSIRAADRNMIVVPALFIAGTDSRHFKDEKVVKDIYLFSPYRQEKDVWLHSVDEKISVDVYKKMIQFYAQLSVESMHC